MRTLLLYGRPGCHLCEVLAEELRPLIEGRAGLVRVNVDRDVQLLERYGPRIPVLLGDGEELSGYPLDGERIERYLRA